MKKGCEKAEETVGKITAVYATDEKYAPYVSVSAASLKANLASGVRAEIFVLHTGLSERTRELLEGEGGVRCLDVSRELSGISEDLYAPSYLSREMYLRALIPLLFPERDRVLYLDCDTVVLGDVLELFSLDMRGRALLAAKNPMHPKMRGYVLSLGLVPEEYVNSGVLLMDVERLLSIGFTARFFAELGERPDLRFPDQDLLNTVLRGEMGELPAEWNYLWHIERLSSTERTDLKLPKRELEEYRAIGERAKLIHYSGDVKPWREDAHPRAEHFFRYLPLAAMREDVSERRRRELSATERVRLLFCDRSPSSLTLTVSHCVAVGCVPSELSYSAFGERCEPQFTLVRRASRGGIATEERVFSFSLALGRLYGEGCELSFFLSGREVLFEYGEYFPLNGIPESYFTLSGVSIYRQERRLVMRKLPTYGRVKLELGYLSALLARGREGVKQLAVRLAYRLLRPTLGRGAWLISDRPDVAGDNGEALFRYLTRDGKRRGVRPYFVVRRGTPDFARLKRVGRVLPLGSLRHKLLALSAEVLAFSHTDSALYRPYERRYVKGMQTDQVRVFLQHGVTKDDISSAYSRFTHGFDLFITAAYPEHLSIITNPRYGLGVREVALTGFPRHDLLLGREAERLILVAPTWRRALVGVDTKEFSRSRYCRAWCSLLSEEGLPAIAKKHGYRVVFLPHHCTLEYISAFSGISPSVELVTGSSRYRELLSRAAITVTDYSSVALETLYLARPSVYYRFDEREFYSSHTCREGYFDPTEDGLGEVARSESEVLSAVERLIFDPDRARAASERASREFFAYPEGGSCRRVVEAIEERLGR